MLTLLKERRMAFKRMHSTISSGKRPNGGMGGEREGKIRMIDRLAL